MTDRNQQTLWSGLAEHPTQAPLADRMRPRTLDAFIGQSKLVGEGRLLRRAIMARNFAAHTGRSSCVERSSARAPGATSLVMTLPEPT